MKTTRTTTINRIAYGVMGLAMAGVWALIAVAVLGNTGCWGFQIKTIMDSATENQIKFMEAKAKIDAEKRKEVYKIEGVVKGFAMKEVEIDDPNPANAKRTYENGKQTKVEIQKIKTKYATLVFEDGREKDFTNVPPVPLTMGKYYVIDYNGVGEFVSAVAKP